MRKAFTTLLVLLFMLGCTSCSVQPNATQLPEEATAVATATSMPAIPQMMPSDELQRGIWYGFIPAEMQTDLDKPVTFAEFSGMVTSMMNVIDDEYGQNWQTVANKAMTLPEIMHRDDAMLMLFLAADSMGQTALRQGWSGRWYEFQDPRIFQQEFSFDYDPYFPQWNAHVPGGWEDQDISYIEAASDFAVGEASLISGKTLLDFDYERNSIRPSDSFTRREAILALTRLYEAVEFNIYTPVENVDPLSISSETLEIAMNMPAASNQSLPEWYGSTMDNMSANWNNDGGVGMMYWEQDVKNFAQMGINFLRVPLDSELIFKDGNLDQVNNAMLKNMDNLVKWGIENGVHICFDLHSTFGFTTDGVDDNDSMFQDEAQQDSFARFWAFMAQRYAPVPNNALSFNLLNEPHGNQLDESTYVSVMMKAINEIRGITPDRLIFVDMFNVAREPIEALIDAGVAQSAHMYLPGIGILNNSDSPYILQSKWPVYLINGFFDRNSNPIMINGEFKAGTTVTVRVDGFHKDGDIVASGDGIELGRYTFGKEQLGENYCNSINEQGTDGENRWYNGAGFTFTLNQDTQKIEIRLTGNAWWFYIRGISITDGTRNTLLFAAGDDAAKTGTLALTVMEDGSVTSQDPEMIMNISDYVDAQTKKYSDFSKESGVPVMIQEFGFHSSSDYDLVLNALDLQLAAFTKYDLNWCMWSHVYGFVAVKDEWKREGATYDQIGDHQWVAVEMLEIMQKYMQ